MRLENWLDKYMKINVLVKNVKKKNDTYIVSYNSSLQFVSNCKYFNSKYYKIKLNC